MWSSRVTQKVTFLVTLSFSGFGGLRGASGSPTSACLFSGKLLWIFSSNLPGNLALKNGGDFWWVFVWSPFPTKRSAKTPQKFGEDSEQNSGQNRGRKFEKFVEVYSRKRAEYCFESTVLEERTHWASLSFGANSVSSGGNSASSLWRTKSRLRSSLSSLPGARWAPKNSLSLVFEPYFPKPYSARFRREAPDTFKFLRHVIRAILSVQPKCSHRCVSLKETPLKPVCASPQAHNPNSAEQTVVRPVSDILQLPNPTISSNRKVPLFRVSCG